MNTKNKIGMACLMAASVPGMASGCNMMKSDGSQDKENISQTKPNVVYIMTDQQSYYAISAITSRLDKSDPYSGIGYFKTPNIDRLVNSGYSFTNCFCSNAVSGPSRFALLTGESPRSYGMDGNVSPGGEGGDRMYEVIQERAMGTLFQKAGYKTYYAGKVHLPWANGRRGKDSIYEPPYKYGFDEVLSLDDREELAQISSDFFGKYNSKDPFLFFISFMNPHDICMSKLLFGSKTIEDFEDNPRELGARMTQLYYRDIFQSMPESDFMGDKYSKLPFNTAKTDKFPLHGIRQETNYNTMQQHAHLWMYYRLLENVDNLIGQVLNTIDASPHKDNTVIIFTSDHGEMGMSHGLFGKNVPYQECQRVPFIFAGKGIPKGVVNDTPVVNGWDLLPTMLDIAGIPVPEGIKGKSLYPVITSGERRDAKYIYLETVYAYTVLGDNRYKYSHFEVTDPKDGNETLFDIKNDPGELHNLIDDPAYAAKAAELRAELERQMQYWGTTYTPTELKSRVATKAKKK